MEKLLERLNYFSGNRSILWTMDYGLWTMDYGLWTMHYGLWTMDYGLWTMDYGLCTMDYLMFPFCKEFANNLLH